MSIPSALRAALASLVVAGLAAPLAAAVAASPATAAPRPAVAQHPAAQHPPVPIRPHTRSTTTFTCSTPTIFLAQATPTTLYGGALGAGKITFSAIGKASTWSYNAIAFSVKTGYLYGISIPRSTQYPAGHLLQINNAGAVTDLGSIAGDPTLQKVGADNGAFDAAGNFWVARTGYPQIDEITLTTKPPKVLKAVKFAPTKPGLLTDDFTYSAGFMWGMAINGSSVVVQRISLTTGAIGTFPAPNVIPVSAAYGAAWTFGNGDLGFQSNQTGQIFELSVKNPSTTPVFSLLSLYSGPASVGNNDGAICAPKPVDLDVVESAPTTASPGALVTWTLSVTNTGPGNSSGFVVDDPVPAGVTNFASTTPGCALTGSLMRCSEGALPVNTGYVLKISGNAPNTANAVIHNPVTVLGNEADPNNPPDNTANATTTLGLVAPKLVMGASPTGTVGGNFGATATLSGGESPTGTINFGLYGPSTTAATCTGTPQTEPVSVTGGNSQYTAPSITLTTTESYVWGASYSGDSNNKSLSTVCGSPFSPAKASPSIAAQPQNGQQGTSFTENANLSVGYNPSGTITFYLETTCGTTAGAPSETATGVSGDNGYTSPAFTNVTQGNYFLVAVYNGDSKNNTATSTCDISAKVFVAGPPPPLNNGYVADTANLENFNPSTINAGTVKVSGTANPGYYIYSFNRTQLIALSPNGAYLYEADNNTGVVYVVATSNDALVATISGFYGGPTAIAMAANGLDVWVATTSGVAEVSTQSNTIVAFIPVGGTYAIAVSPNSEVVYAVGSASGIGSGVTEIDAATDSIITASSLSSACQSSSPYSIVIASGGSTGEQGFVTCEESGQVGALVGVNLDPTPTTQQEAIIGTAPTGQSPIFPVVSGTRLYVANYNSGSVTVINTSQLGVQGGNPVVATLTSGGNPDALAVDNGVLYVADYNGGVVTPYNTTTNAELASGTITVGSGPDWIATDGSNVYVANFGSQDISVIVSPSQPATSILLTGSPFDIQFANPPPATKTSLAASNISTGSNGNLSLSGAPASVTYTATITPKSGSATVTDGTVSFADQTGVLDGLANGASTSGSCGAVPVNSSGVATCAVSYGSAGHDALTAIYSGDSATFNGSTSNSLNEAISWTAGGPPNNTAYVANTSNGELFQTSSNVGGGALPASNAGNYYCYNYGSQSRPPVAVMTPNGSYVYEVNSSSPGEVFVFSTSSGASATPAPITGLYGQPTTIAMSPNGQDVWVGTNQGVDEIATATNTVIAIIPTGGQTCALKVSPSGKLIYAIGSATSFGDALTEINASTDSIFYTLDLTGVGCTYLPDSLTTTTVANDAATIKTGVAGFATCTYNNPSPQTTPGYLMALMLDNLTTLAPAAKLLGKTIQPSGNCTSTCSVGGIPVSPVVAPATPGGAVDANATVFVANYGTGTLSAIAINQFGQPSPAVSTIPDGSGSQPDALAVADVTVNGSSQEILYVANYDSTTTDISSTVVPYVISSNSATEMGSGPILVGSEPDYLAVDGTSLYVSDYGGTPTSTSGNGAITIVDTTSGAVTATANVTSAPLDIVFANTPQATINTLSASNISSGSNGSLSLSTGSPATVTYTATVTLIDGFTPATDGTVAFADSTGILNGLANSASAQSSCGVVPVNSSGIATCTVAYTSSGNDAITSVYSGDNNVASGFDGSTSNTLTEAMSWSSGGPPNNTAYVASTSNGELFQTSSNIGGGPLNASNAGNYNCYNYYSSSDRSQIAAITPNGSYVYEVNSSSPGAVYVVSTSSGALATQAPMSGLYGQPTTVAMSPNGQDVWVGTNQGVDEIATATNTVIAIIPTGGQTCALKVSPNGNVVYAIGSATSFSDALTEINAATATIYDTVNLTGIGCTYLPNSLTITAVANDSTVIKTGEAGFSTCTYNNPSPQTTPGYLMGLVLDVTTTGTPKAQLLGATIQPGSCTTCSVGGIPISPVVAPATPGGTVDANATVFVANYGTGTLSGVAINQFGAPSPSVSTIPDGTGSQPDALAIGDVTVGGTTQQILYAANYDSSAANIPSTVVPYLVSGTSASEMASGPILVGSEPNYLAVDGNALYVSDYGGTATSGSGTGAVTLIDTTSGAVTSTINLSSAPLNVVLANAPQPTVDTIKASNISSGSSGSLNLTSGAPTATVTYTATVTLNDGTTPATDGSVAFSDASGVLNGLANSASTPSSCGAVPVNGSGVATCTVTYSSSGNDAITAVYGGDNNVATGFDGSTSNSLTEAIKWTSGTPPNNTAYVANTQNGELLQTSTGLAEGQPDSATNSQSYQCYNGINYSHQQVAAMTPNGSYAYEVNSSYPGEIFVVSTSSGSLLYTLGGLGGEPTSIVVAPNGLDVWIGTNSGVAEVSTASNKVVAVIPVGDVCNVAVSPNSSVVYAIGGAGLTEINSATGAIFDNVSLSGVSCNWSPFSLSVTAVTPVTPVTNPTGEMGFSSCGLSNGQGKLIGLALDPSPPTGSASGQAELFGSGVPVGSAPVDPVAAPATPGGAITTGGTVFVANEGSGTISAVAINNLGSSTQAPPIPDGTGTQPDALAVDEVTVNGNSEEVLYVANYDQTATNVPSTVTPYLISGNSATEMASGPILVGSEPDWLAVDGASLYVADYGGTPATTSGAGAISVIDTTSGAVTSTVTLTGQPLDIVFANPGQATKTKLQSSNATPTAGGAAVTYTATVTLSDGTTAVTDTSTTVSFFDGSGVLNGVANGSGSAGSCAAVPINSSGVATCAVSYNSAGGLENVTATYSGNATTYDGSTSSQVPETISWPNGSGPPKMVGYVSVNNDMTSLNTVTNKSTATFSGTNMSVQQQNDYGQSIATADGYVYEINDNYPYSVYAINIGTQAVTTIPFIGSGTPGAFPYALVEAPNGNELYVATNSGVTVINTPSNTIASSLQIGSYQALAVSSNSSVLYLAGSTNGGIPTGFQGGLALTEVNVANSSSLTVMGSTAVGGDGCTSNAYQLAMNTGDTNGYLTCPGTGSTGVVVAVTTDATNTGSGPNAVGGTTVGQYPVSEALSGKFLYVACEGQTTTTGTVAVVDTTAITGTSSNAVVQTLSDGGGSEPDAVAVDGSTLYVANAGYNTVTPYTLNAASQTPATAMPSGPIYLTGTNPTGLFVDGESVYAVTASGNPAATNEGTISVIDSTSGAITQTIPIAGVPYGIAFG